MKLLENKTKIVFEINEIDAVRIHNHISDEIIWHYNWFSYYYNKKEKNWRVVSHIPGPSNTKIISEKDFDLENKYKNYLRKKKLNKII